MPSAYIYVVARDFGFAPNPFHGYCTLATCKPGVRKGAHVGDWVIGMGGSRLSATGRCIYAMEVTRKISFDDYWASPEFYEKKPVRNGSNKMLLGDNIYYRNSAASSWQQIDSHHSNPDGTPNALNLKTDTSANAVLISRRFFYFGKKAPLVPAKILQQIGYENVRSYRRLDYATAKRLLDWIVNNYSKFINLVVADPFDFFQGGRRYSGKGNKLV